MATTYYIADTHFYHANIIKYCKRPFQNAEEMNEYMIERWNQTVKPDDIVIHVGDFAMGNTLAQQKIFIRLNGHKILVLGNHDGNKRYMLNVGFEEVHDYIYRDGLLIMHDPMFVEINLRGDGLFTFEERYNECDYFLHGHVHNHYVHNKKLNKAINCCVENHDYTPKTLEQLVGWMQETRQLHPTQQVI